MVGSGGGGDGGGGGDAKQALADCVEVNLKICLCNPHKYASVVYISFQRSIQETQ